jgi:hypothetical protein
MTLEQVTEQKKTDTWEDLVSTLAKPKEILEGSSAVLRTASHGSFYIEIVLSKDNKDKKDEFINDDKLVNEFFEVVLPWVKRKAKSNAFKGVVIVSSHEDETKIYNIINELGAQLIHLG